MTFSAELPMKKRGSLKKQYSSQLYDLYNFHFIVYSFPYMCYDNSYTLLWWTCY